MKPLAIDLFCGLGGWAEGFLAEGYDVIGFDIESRPYPGQLVLQDVLTLHGSQFRDVAAIVASPPCQKYSYMAMPWKRAKERAAWYRADLVRIVELNALFDACFRIQREASEAAGHEIPMVVENVKGAQPWVGRARWHFGSFYLWGDVPALMPFAAGRKNGGGSWFNVANNTDSGHGQNPDGRKVAAKEFDGYGGGFGWDKSQMRQGNSHSPGRKAASAEIAKIPFPLAQHIAAVFKPSARRNPSTFALPDGPNQKKGTETKSLNLSTTLGPYY